MKEIENIINAASTAITQISSLAELEKLRVEFLGKKGKLTELLKQVGKLSAEERPKAGQAVNQAKDHIQELIEQHQQILQAEALVQQLRNETIDITLPGRGEQKGSLHPVTLTRLRIEKIFQQMGFSIVEGPEAEDKEHNFYALNIPAHHPALQMHDTFYIDDDLLLRTHTSPVQIRAMKNKKPPLRLIAPGRVYRCDFDVTHTPMFHQIEGLMVDKNISFADLKGVVTHFLKIFFERDFAVRFRASYFPFTEPSAEIDITCTQCNGAGCRVCKETGWLEIMGCGMVHPHVLQTVGIDPDIYSGFAFGVGIDRMAMLRYEINDLRMLFENDLRLLEQF